jgi:hypothetical protein
MSLTSLFHGVSPRGTPSSFGKMRVAREHVAQSVAPALKETGKFVLTMAILAVIMAALAALDIFIWMPRVH